MMLLRVLPLIVLLAGCSSLSGPSLQATIETDQSACSTYGFTRGTDGFAQCMMLRDQQRQENDRERRRAIGQAIADLGKSMNPPPPTTCRTTGSAFGMGGTVYGNSTTRCY